MAGALIKGLVHGGHVAAQDISASDVKAARLEELHTSFGILTTSDNVVLVKDADVIVVSVKPQIVDRVLPVIRDHASREALVISIAAGVPISVFEEELGPGAKVIRTMPNTAAIAQAGATALAAGSSATAEDMLIAVALFEAVGRCTVLDENLLDAVTGLSGSGPAYVMLNGLRVRLQQPRHQRHSPRVLHRNRRWLQARVPNSSFAMHLGGAHNVPTHRARRAFCHRYIVAPVGVQQAQRVERTVAHIRIAANCGDGQQM